MKKTKMNGILVVDKAIGMTSFDVLRKLKRLLGVKKMGHTGTLDPAASGVLIVCLGSATRWVSYLVNENKSYIGSVKLGITTDTDDADGSILVRKKVPFFEKELLDKIFAQLTGPLEQIPPAYSAIKVDGKRAYAQARAGKSVFLAPRNVQIHRFECTNIAHTTLDFIAEVSKGTYIRSLARDVGEILNVGAHLCRLRRTHIGSTSLAKAQSLEDIKENGPNIISCWEALDHFPVLEITEIARNMLRNGLKPRNTSKEEVTGKIFRVAKEDGTLLGLVHLENRDGVLRIIANRLTPSL